MDIEQFVVVDIGPQAEEVVQSVIDQFLVTGYRSSRDDDRVAGADADGPVFITGHAYQSRGGLALTAGTNYDHLLRREPVDLVNRQQHFGRYVEVTQLDGHLDVVDHAASHHADPPMVSLRYLDDLLDARNIGSKSSYNDPPFGLGENALKGLSDLLLRVGIARGLGVGRIGEEDQYASPPQFGQLGKVGQLPVYRAVVEFEIAGVDHQPHRCVYSQSHAVGDTVTDPEEFHTERSQGEDITRLDGMEGGFLQQLVFLQLDLNQSSGQPGGIDRGVHLGQHVG